LRIEYPHDIQIYIFLRFSVNIMKDDIVKHEENIANILNRVISLCKKTGYLDVAKKGEKILKNYDNFRKKNY